MDEPHDATTRGVGQRIAAARRAARLTQAELAARAGWPRDTLINVEHGRRPITVERLAQVAAALGLPPALLLIDEAQTARLIGRLLAGSDELRGQVAFFLDSLEAAEVPDPR